MSDDAADRLRELGKQLPFEKPDAERREALRSALLVAATQDHPSSTRKRWILVGGGFAAGALAAAAIAIVVILPRDADAPATQPREAHARVEAPSTAKLEHTVTTSETGTDEVVRVRAGVVRVAVPAVQRGDRVRMQTADAELEGTGAYEVAVVDDRLERVTVTEGRAQLTIRVSGKQQQIVLATGQTWRPTIVTAEIELAAPAQTTPIEAAPTAPAASEAQATSPVSTGTASPMSPPAASRTTPPTPASTTRSDATSRTPASTTRSGATSTASPAPTSTSDKPAGASSPAGSRAGETPVAEPTGDGATGAPPSSASPAMPAVTSLAIKPGPSTTEQHFQKGWALLRAGKAREAAIELGLAADASANDPLAADARYFQAVALVRAGAAKDAERVLVAFLDRAPTSLRRGRAAVLLGKLLRDRGDTKSARAWFESALGDADPAIAAAARAHLDSLR